ncbi:hypothetical protein Kpol_1026p14 [Vanderwaltozyma polyspora DSM 70294]|uniref:Uncharacterized protein n=1 Tax=Vanderwaltozyma polyspora (strain ATCC 22028 / DSM 70294 / BCRC 21397 / CBS 2163 / NBRC 10782 / NRRL Y-8283 / UCD 57-17) TaxID=436907 RepID=A7TNI4_VANPO|nr:uncharacterized protein Kpol_1026p14 [Vanderwaltozyma polyspora DSM 70294]EDO16167.1 hypothetical protein Kpol_1026p14 [Vanderwaltozyma polyspora DSM 70294]
MLLRNILKSSTLSRAVRLAPIFKPTSIQSAVVPKRWYAKSWDDRQANNNLEAHLKVQKLMDDINSHPTIVSKLEDIKNIMVEKGLVNSDEDKRLGIKQMINILMDKDLRRAMNELKEELANAGIQLGPDQLGPLMTVLGLEQPKK